jgi:hypothetical protein
MTKYFICNTDTNGQRTGSYYSIMLNDSDIDIVKGLKFYKGKYLYDNEFEALKSCLN